MWCRTVRAGRERGVKIGFSTAKHRAKKVRSISDHQIVCVELPAEHHRWSLFRGTPHLRGACERGQSNQIERLLRRFDSIGGAEHIYLQGYRNHFLPFHEPKTENHRPLIADHTTGGGCVADGAVSSERPPASPPALARVISNRISETGTLPYCRNFRSRRQSVEGVGTSCLSFPTVGLCIVCAAPLWPCRCY